MRNKILALLILIPFSLSFANTVDIWYGGQFERLAWDDVMVVTPGEWVDIPVYVMGDSRNLKIADMMLPLGINKQYIDQFNIQECQALNSLSNWDVTMFANLNDDFEEGWASLSFLGFAQIYSDNNGYGVFNAPTKVLTFRVHFVEDEQLMDQIVSNAIGAGQDPFQGQSNMGDISGAAAYEVRQHFAAMHFSPTSVDPIAPVPAEFFLSDSYPNPFNAVSLLKYGIPEDAFVQIDLYDVLGRRVETLVSEDQEAGYHQVTFRADEYSSGMYFYKMSAGNFSETKKMTLIK